MIAIQDHVSITRHKSNRINGTSVGVSKVENMAEHRVEWGYWSCHVGIVKVHKLTPATIQTTIPSQILHSLTNDSASHLTMSTTNVIS